MVTHRLPSPELLEEYLLDKKFSLFESLPCVLRLQTFNDREAEVMKNINESGNDVCFVVLQLLDQKRTKFGEQILIPFGYKMHTFGWPFGEIMLKL